ncbi:hypothetical protein TIFTF001_039104 [Ficus carica]|uniref:C-JID domain-containing protein n=1 Tax=Ficus carica TaxID=3494 RepID=A0AA88EBR9_FICCA|nr:hypothetical protein TIFTF001_039104 [Ficus carica]
MLVALNMQGSQLEKLWEGSPHLDKLKFVDLAGSKHLTQVPDLSKAPNIKRVNLEFCASLIEVPSYFQHLKKLKELSLIGCPSLCKLSGLPKNLKTLKVLTEPLDHRDLYKSCRHCGNNLCTWFPSLDFPSKLERFPKISEPMEFIETLKLDFAAIKVLSPSIKNLIGLKQLSLKFCQNLEFLPDSIRSLSTLRKLSIDFCQKLESLPVLPSSLSVLDAVCCTSLKMVSSSIPLVKQNWDDLYNRGYRKEVFRFLGCQMLDENTRKVLVDEALFRILRFATLLHKYGYERCTWVTDVKDIYWPGSEIPRWFSHRSEGCSICINLPHPDQWYNSSYLGFVSCIIVEYNDLSTVRPSSLELHWDSVYTFPNGDSWRQRKDVNLDMLFYYRTCAFSGCHSAHLSDFRRKNIHDSLNNSEYVYTIMGIHETFGDFLKSNNGKFDANGNKFPRTAKVDFHVTRRGKYFKAKDKAKEGMFDANGSVLTRTATASFSFKLSRESRRFAKIKKCGVHLLYTQEAERFGYVERIEFKSNGDEAVYSDSNRKEEEEEDDDGGESESSGSEVIFSESEQEEDGEEGDGRESASSGGESIKPESEQEEDEEEGDGRESESSGGESIKPESDQEEDVCSESESSRGEGIHSKSEQEVEEEDNGGGFESRGREAIYSESKREEHDEPLHIIGCWSGFRWLLERFCLFRSGCCWNG